MKKKTRMHSSGMRTTCSLPYGGRGWGLCPVGGSLSKGSLCPGGSVQQGGLCPAGGLCQAGGSMSSRGVSVQGGLCPEGSLSMGVSVKGGSP